MKSYLITALLLVATLALGQQRRLTYGLAVSADYNSYLLVSDAPGIDNRGKMNYSTGLVLRVNGSGKTSFSGKFMYSTKNFNQKIDFAGLRITNPNDPLLTSNGIYAVDFVNHYVDLPVELGHRLSESEKHSLLLTLGVINSLVVHRSVNTDLAGYNINRKVYNSHLLSGKFGIGWVTKLDKIGLSIEPQVRYYITEVHNAFPDHNPIHFGVELQVFKLD